MPSLNFKRTKRTADNLGNLRAAVAQASPPPRTAACFFNVFHALSNNSEMERNHA